jgi:hypothetical protein
MLYKGIVIEESLQNISVIKKLYVISTKVESVTESHQTPWLKQWTLHTVEISEENMEKISKEISESLESEHQWYADFKNPIYHYVIFKNKVFKVERSKPEEYRAVKEYGVRLGIPDYQLDFSPGII